MGNSTTATALNFIDSLTSIFPPPQVGSEGNNIVLSSSGIVTLSGSAINGWQATHGGSTNPQGYTILFTNAAPNNKADSAFGFQDTMSSSFKTAIWSDGSVAHPAFGFNVSEFQSIYVPATMGTETPYQIAKGTGTGPVLAGTYELMWDSNGYRQQHMIVAVGYAFGDGYALITVLHNWFRGDSNSIGTPTVAYDSSHVPYLVADLSPTVAGTLSVQARGYDTNIALLESPTGTTILSAGVLVNTVNQTSGGTLLSYNSLTSASSNAVTNKIKIDINGTTYYLLASTISS